MVRTWYVSVASRAAGPGILQRTSNARGTYYEHPPPSLRRFSYSSRLCTSDLGQRATLDLPYSRLWFRPVNHYEVACGLPAVYLRRVSSMLCLTTTYVPLPIISLYLSSWVRLCRSHFYREAHPGATVSLHVYQSAYLSRSSRMHRLEADVTVHSALARLYYRGQRRLGTHALPGARRFSSDTAGATLMEATRVAEYAHASTAVHLLCHVAAQHHWRCVGRVCLRGAIHRTVRAYVALAASSTGVSKQILAGCGMVHSAFATCVRCIHVACWRTFSLVPAIACVADRRASSCSDASTRGTLYEMAGN